MASNRSPVKAKIILSVIVIAHDEEGQIKECLSSIVKQQCDGVELIVVDDHSMDKTPGILAGFANKHSNLCVVRNDDKLGAGHSRNAGIAQAIGRYLMFVDGDDYLVDDSLSRIIEQLMEESPDVLVFNHNLVYDDGLVLEARQVAILESSAQLTGDAQKQRLLELYQIACNKAYSAELIKKNMLYFKAGNYEDTAYAFKSLLLGQRISVSTQAYYNYRQRHGTAPYRPNKKESRVDQHFLVLRYDEIFEFIKQNDLTHFSEAIYGKMLIQYNAILGERYDAKDKGLFKKMQASLIEYQPAKIQWPTFRSRIAYWCIRLGMVRVLIILNRVYSRYRRYRE